MIDKPQNYRTPGLVEPEPNYRWKWEDTKCILQVVLFNVCVLGGLVLLAMQCCSRAEERCKFRDPDSTPIYHTAHDVVVDNITVNGGTVSSN